MKLKLLMPFFKLFCLLFLIQIGCDYRQDTKIESIHGQAMESGQDLGWFQDAKFGMFIHWGPYSELAGEWNDLKIMAGRNAEWIMKYLNIPVMEYRDMAHKMNPQKFNAHEWVQLAKSTGMKYIVVTAKHHDGFAMYHSKVSEYNIVDWTPFDRDPLTELSIACAEEGIKFCIYYSHREDWDHPGGYGNDWDYDNDWGMDLYDPIKFTDYLKKKAKPQLRELLTNYGPIGLIWFDRGMYTREQGQEFVNLIRSIQPSTLINGRVGHYYQDLLGDFQDMNDKGIPVGGLDEYFQTPQTLNETWGFSKFDTLWKSSETVIAQLVQVVSLGGNYLLNIGPKGDGEIPDATIKIFSKVGEWVERNSESIYGTTANPFNQLDWGGYCTVKGNKLYLFVKDWPQDNLITISGLKNSVNSAYCLKDKSKKLSVLQVENTTQIKVPSEAPDHPFSVLVLEMESFPKVDPQIVLQDSTGKIFLDYLTALSSGKTMTRYNRKGGFHISKWTEPKDQVMWNLRINEPGIFKINISYSANKESEGKRFELNIGNSNIEKTIIYTGDWFEYQTFPCGYIEIPKAGDYTLTIKPKENSDSYLMYLSSITISPHKVIKKAGWGIN